VTGKRPPRGERLFSVTLNDCEIQTFTAGGPGGQHQNHSNTAVRIIHKASGAAGTSRTERSQLQNKKAAFRRMTEDIKFKVWLNREIFRRQGKASPEELAAKDMVPDNLRVEVREDGKWTRES
jgi:protein subunit release factor B